TRVRDGVAGNTALAEHLRGIVGTVPVAGSPVPANTIRGVRGLVAVGSVEGCGRDTGPLARLGILAARPDRRCGIQDATELIRLAGERGYALAESRPCIEAASDQAILVAHASIARNTGNADGRRGRARGGEHTGEVRRTVVLPVAPGDADV